MISESSQRDPVELLAEEFAERRRKGEQPTLEEYCAKHPELADEIRDVFPALLMMEEMVPQRGELTGPLLTREIEASAIPQKLGEYRILREIGHGGMGIVYEAVQESLGRHVALKVLPFHALLQPTHLERFRREAKAAARLHHTNIVPVFGVGDHNGIHFFAMQYIQGQGLDVVLKDLKKLRGLKTGRQEETPKQELTGAASVAVSLLSGQFASPEQAEAPQATVTTDNLGAGAPSVGSPGQAGGSRDVTSSQARAVNPSFTTQAVTQYFRSIAQLGVQTADALAYAHKQGVLHRDIKPSNLLLDLQGTVWITDFGLAKSEGTDEITHTGDIVGTLRYMAPERFRGWSDPRSDVYSLGITLFEMLTLRPAFEAPSKGSLIDRIVHESPPVPRALDSRIPRDLETIVLKAIDKEPARRYQTAGELAEDLRRYLSDKPIQARRAGTWDRFRKWVKRRPAVAALGACLLLAVMGLLGMGAWSYLQISKALQTAEEKTQAALEAREQEEVEREKAVAARTEAEKLRDAEASQRKQAEESRAEAEKLRDAEANQRKQAEGARKEAEKLRDAAVAETYRALLSETKAIRLTHQPGWRYHALKNLQNLGQMKTPRRELPELRAEAVASLLELDARETFRLVGHQHDVQTMDFSLDSRTLLTADLLGSIRSWDVAKGTPLREITDGMQGPIQRLSHAFGYPVVRTDPRGRYTAYTAAKNRIGFVSLKGPKASLPRIEYSAPPRSLAIDGQGRHLAVGWADGMVGLYDASTGETKRLFNTQPPPVRLGPAFLAAMSWAPQANWPSVGPLVALSRGGRQRLYPPPENYYVAVALSPGATLLAMPGPEHSVELQSLSDNRPAVRLTGHRGPIRRVAFSPSSPFLLTASFDQSAKIWDLRTGKEHLNLLGHTGPVTDGAFSPDGALVATVSHDGTARLWDTRTGQVLTTLRPNMGYLMSVAFSPDGTRLALANRTVSLFDVVGLQERRRLPGHTSYVYGLAFDPLRPQFATASTDGTVRFWDLKTGRPGRSLQVPEASGLAFSGDGELLAVGRAVEKSTAVPPILVLNLVTGKRIAIPGHSSYTYSLAFDPAGKRLASVGYGGTLALADVASGEVLKLWKGAGGGHMNVAFLNKGRQLLTGTRSNEVVILDTDSGRVVQQKKLPHPPWQVKVSPRGDRVAVLLGDGALHLLKVPELEPVAVVQKAHPGAYHLAFNPDGALLASAGGPDRQVHLWETTRLGKVTSLPGQNAPIHGIGFDPEGTQLVIIGAEGWVTQVNLGRVGSHLAALGLGLDVLPRSAEPLPGLDSHKPEPPKVVTGPPSQTQNPLALRDRALQLFRQRKWAELIPVSRKAIAFDPEVKELYQFLGEALYQQGEYTKSVAAYEDHLKRCKDCPMALHRIGLGSLMLKDHEKAVKYFERSLTVRTNNDDPYYQLGWIHAFGPPKLRDPAKVLKYAQRAVSFAPDQTRNRSLLGRAYYRAGQYDKGVETLLRAESPTEEAQNAADLLFLAACYHKLNRVKEAKIAYDRALTKRGPLKLSAFQQEAWMTYKAEVDQVLGIPRKK